jgi:hypothetical protein
MGGRVFLTRFENVFETAIFSLAWLWRSQLDYRSTHAHADRSTTDWAIALFSLALKNFSDLCLLGWARDGAISLAFDVYLM